MWAQVDRILRDATTKMADHTAEFLPGLLAAIMLAAVTVLVALLLRTILLRVLRGLEFDRRAEQYGVATIVAWPPLTASQTVARAAFWTIVLLGLMVSLTALDATIAPQLALSVLEYVPHLVAALLILLFGAVAAQFLARSVLIGAVNMQLHSARFLSLAVKWLVLLVTVAMALDHLGIGRRILLLAFGILFAGIVFAAALAVGLGARDVVSDALARQMREPARREEPVYHV